MKRCEIRERPTLIRFNKNVDKRGFFASPFSNSEIKKLNAQELYISISFTNLMGTVRGMHFQTHPFCEAKLLTVLQGSIHDIVINTDQTISKEERIFQFELSDKDNSCLYIPKGYAHGYQAQTDNVLIMYALDSKYSKLNTQGFSPLSENLLGLWPKMPINIKKEDLAWPKYT